jgi:mRNA-degrading endonuclease RelE of RelBE toxin-antitoxin system
MQEVVGSNPISSTNVFFNITSKNFLLLFSTKEYSPYPSGVKKIKSYDNTYRIRAGNYRILYTIDGGRLIINIIDIVDRKEIYEYIFLKKPLFTYKYLFNYFN